MSLASRRGSRSDTNPDDAKSSIVGLSGWLFADLLLALAVVFLVASDRPAESVVGDAFDIYDIGVEFALSLTGEAETQIDQIDQSFDIWVRFSEAVDARSFKEIRLEPKDQWSYRFVDKRDSGPQEAFQIRLNPERVSSSALSITIERRAARHFERENSYNSKATLAVSITVCRSLAGIAVKQDETARFLIPGGANKSASELSVWLSDPSRSSDIEHPPGSRSFRYGTAALLYKEWLVPIANRRQVGFAILFGGYNRATESADEGSARARKQSDNVRQALRNLGLLSSPGSSGPNRCPESAEVPVRAFGDATVSTADLQFELYFYNLGK